MGLSDEELDKIKQMHAMGMHQGEIARQLKRDPSTISRAFKRLKLSATQAQRCATKKATDARRAYDLKRRMELNNKALRVAEEFLDKFLDESKELSSKDYKNIMIGLGIAEDKRRILEPQKPEQGRTKLDTLIEAMEKDEHPVPVPEAEGSIPRLSEDSSNSDVRVSPERKN